MSKIYMVLDIGTSYIKCGCINSEFNILSQYQREFPMEQKEHSFEIDFDLFSSTTINLISECLADQIAKRSTVEALLITSQVQTFTAVDADFSPIYKGLVWLDERAEKEAAYLKEQLPDFANATGFNNPVPGLYISKLLWLKQNEPTIFKKAKAFPVINEYLTYKLTGKFYTDVTSFGMSGMYDFRRNSINPELLTILGLTEDSFPTIENAAVKGELISQQMQQEWKLKYRFPVFLCGNDQGASACGAGVKRSGDVNINFGTAMVSYTVTKSLVTDLMDYQIAGKHPVGDAYFLLSVESDFGIQIRRLKEIFFREGTYDQLFQTYLDYPEVDERTPLSGEVALNSLEPADAHQLYAGIIKYYLERLNIHFTQVCKTIHLKNIFISGGMSQSKVWLDILRSTLEQPFTVNNRANAGLYGAMEIYNANF